MNIYPRETVEFVPVTVLVDNVIVTNNIEFSISYYGDRPIVWDPSVVLGNKIGFMINHPHVGLYRVWARITDSPEIPVIDCGMYKIS